MRPVLAAAAALVLAGCSRQGPGEPPPPPVCGAETLHSGDGTYYAADGSGNCSFEATGDPMVAAINQTDYGGGAACGACIEIEGPLGSIVVRIVDRCLA